MKPKLISFDADGTLVNRNFVEKFWFEKVPRLYAGKNGMDFKQARDYLTNEYNNMGDEDIRWYLPHYWFERFDFDRSPGEIAEELKNEVEIYPDALTVLEKLNRKYDLIVISNGPREFLEIELETIQNFFSALYSCVSDLKRVKKDPEVYHSICKRTGYEPREMLHIGDDWKFDYLTPREAGVNTIFVDRYNEKDPEGDGIVRDLTEIFELLN